MRCGTFLNKIFDVYHPVGSDMYGALVAENRLVEATLTADETVCWNFWVRGLNPSLSNRTTFGVNGPCLLPLSTRFGDRVMLGDVSNLHLILRGRDAIFPLNFLDIPLVMGLREQLADVWFPVCGLVHSIRYEFLTTAFLTLALGAEDCDAIVVSSLAGKRTLQKMIEAIALRIGSRFGESATRLIEKIRLVHIPFGVNIPPQELLDSQRARATLGITSHAFTLLYLGRFSEAHKADLDPLIVAVTRLSNEGCDIRLILAGQEAGDRPYGQYIEKRLAHSGILGRTLVLRNFPEYLKSTIFAACDAFVSPVDSIQETFGLAVLEAMAHSKPVIASNWSGHRELVEDGKSGLLLDTKWCDSAGTLASLSAAVLPDGEAAHYLAQRTVFDVDQLVAHIRTFVANPTVAQNMGEYGRRRAVEHFSWPTVSRSFLSLWAEQIDRARRMVPPRRHHTSYNDLFSHYANGAVSPNDELRLAASKGRMSVNSWPFAKPDVRTKLEATLKACGHSPVRVGTMSDLGYPLDFIIWLVKKGFCRLVSS